MEILFTHCFYFHIFYRCINVFLLKDTLIKLPITYDADLAKGLENTIILIKYGGNAMVDDEVKQGVVKDITTLKKPGAVPVIVHGGGRAIKSLMEKVGLESEFISGHRKTDAEAMRYVEMALSGSVNSDLVKLINGTAFKAVGLSGKDGAMVIARKRMHQHMVDGKPQEMDLGFVAM